jgi:hypothetical protein
MRPGAGANIWRMLNAPLAGMAGGLGLMALAAASSPALAAVEAPSPLEAARPLLAHVSARADFKAEPASTDARRVADWVMASGDNGAMPFIIIDKINARVFVFDVHGALRGAAPALLGLAKGDDTVPGIGRRKLTAMAPGERTTPAGRFVADIGHDLEQDVLWVDYKDGIALHRVKVFNPKDHRFARLASASLPDKRISYGCINVPVKFYDSVVMPAFTGTSGIVYILPDTKAIGAVFALHAAASPAGQVLVQAAPGG